MFRGEVHRPAWMVFQPIVHVVSIVRGQVVADEVAAPRGIADVGQIEQIDEGIAIVVFRNKPEQLVSPHVVGSHQAERAVANVLELAAAGLAWPHRDVWVLALQRLHARLFVEADDVFVGRRLVVQVQHIVALGAKFLVVRYQPHLLSMRLQVCVVQDSRNAPVANFNALLTHVGAKQSRRPLCYGDPDIARRLARFGFNPGRGGLGEREGGRPDRGASTSLETGSSVVLKRWRHSNAVRSSTPTACAVSRTLTPLAMSSSASPRLTTRFSAVAGRIAASTASRCSGVSGSGVARGPRCGLDTQGSGLIMPLTLHPQVSAGQFSGERH